MTATQKLIIVDDEIDVAFAFKLILERYGFSVDVFYKPSDALAKFKSNVYKLALLDVKMTEMNGFELYQRMNNIDSNMKVCFMSAGETYHEDFKKTFPQLDDKHFLLKPIENELLVARIRQLINNY